MILATVTALPLVVLAGVAAMSVIDNQRAQLKNEVAGKVNGLLNDIDSQINAIQVELKVLSQLPSIQSGDIAAFDRQLRAAIRVYGTALVLHDTQGQQIINTNRPFGEPLPGRLTRRCTIGSSPRVFRRSPISLWERRCAGRSYPWGCL